MKSMDEVIEMTLESAWRKIMEFQGEHFPSWKEKLEIYYSNALAGEVGEVCNLTKKRIGGGTNKRVVLTTDVLEEIADVFIYLVLLVEKLDYSVYTFEQFVFDKITMNECRVKTESD